MMHVRGHHVSNSSATAALVTTYGTYLLTHQGLSSRNWLPRQLTEAVVG